MYATPIKPIDSSKIPILEKIEEISLYGNVFGGVFPIDFLKLPNLKILRIVDGKISTISPNVPNSNLENLVISNNTLTEFPSQFKTIKSLKYLTLNNNEISGNFPDLSEFENLSYLNIDNNGFEGEIIVPENLNHLIASNNNFSKISKLNTNSNLASLNLSNNENFVEIADDFFAGLNSMQNINLSSTGIQKLPYSIFGLSKLNNFDISNNKNLNAEIVKCNTKISNCYFANTNISCYQQGSCLKIEDQIESVNGNYNECSAELIESIRKQNDQPVSSKSYSNDSKNGDKKNPKSKLSIIIVIVIILIGIIGFFWMYKSYQKKKRSREADIIVSPTVKTSNYYDELFNKEKKKQNDQTFDNNKQHSFRKLEDDNNDSMSPVSRVLPESLNSPTTSVSHRSQDLSNNTPVDTPSPRDVNSSTSYNNSSTVPSTLGPNTTMPNTTMPNTTGQNTTEQNAMARSPSVPSGHSTRVGPMMRSPTAPAGRFLKGKRSGRSLHENTPIVMSKSITNSPVIGNTSVAINSSIPSPTVNSTSMVMNNNTMQSSTMGMGNTSMIMNNNTMPSSTMGMGNTSMVMNNNSITNSTMGMGNTSMVMNNNSMPSPALGSASIVMNNSMTSPLLANTSMTMNSTMTTPLLVNTSMNMNKAMASPLLANTSMTMTNPVIGNTSLLSMNNSPVSPRINKNKGSISNDINNSMNINYMNKQSIAVYQMNNINSNMNNINSNMYYGNSSSSKTINPYENRVDESIDDIKLKKKILQEREILAKYNMYQGNQDDSDKDNNLPPYSEM